MNSIDSLSKSRLTAKDAPSNESATSHDADPAALEMLRALMGNFGPSQASGNSLPTDEDDAPDLSGLVTLISQALSGETLSPEVVKALQGLKKAIEESGNPADQALLAQILLKALQETNRPPSEIKNSESPRPQATVLRDPASAFASGPSNPVPREDSKALAQELLKLLTKPDSTHPQSASKDVEASGQEPQSEQPNLGQSILQSLGAQSSSATPDLSASTQVSQAPTTERVEQVSALMTEMADRVLVSDPAHGQTQEVRIKLAENVMPGTEVRMWREDGTLRIAFDTNSPYWARVLNDASPSLAQHLNDRLSLPAAPQIVVQQHDGQPEDGRSRNRYTPWDPESDSAES